MITLITLLFAHWFGDFVCQTRYMADNKSKSLKALGLHVAVYSFVLLAFAALLAPSAKALLLFFAANFAAHFLTDFYTSKLTSYFWAQKQIKAFFTTIGFDQWLHATTLILTSYYFL